MSLINKISKFLNRNSLDSNTDNETLHNKIFLNYLLVIIGSFSLIFSVIHFFFFEKAISYFLFSYFVIFTVLFLIFRKKGRNDICSIISLILITSLYLLIIFAGAGDKTGIIWGLTYPIAISIAFDYKKGNIFSILFFVITLFIFIVPSSLWAEYSIDLKMRYTGAYIGIFFLIQYFLRIQKQLKNSYEKVVIESKRKLYEKNKLLSKLSYQIRTPLNNIAGVMNLSHNVLDKDTVEEIEISISNLINLANSISTFNDNKTLQIKGKKSFFNINTTVKKSVSLFQSNKYTNLKCVLDLSDDIDEDVFGDRLIFIQIILAVIDFYYNNKKKNGTLSIDISTLKSNKTKCFALKISSNIKFDIFSETSSVVDLDKIDNKDISVIIDLVNSLDSKFKIVIEKNTTSFLFDFIFADEENEKTKLEQINNVVIDNKKHTTELKDANILLVEDDAINSKIMTLNLKKYVNNVIIAENGKDALDKFSSTKIDLILMDIRMPLMDGYKTTEKIRKAEAMIGSKIPIIAVTANVSSETRLKVFEVGMNDYTTKPVNFNILIKKMEALLS